MPIDFEGLRAALAERYDLERELGHGTAATVFLAQDKKVPKKVAIKVLDPDLALAVRSERFLREIEYTARLSHPHILAVTDSGVAYDPQTGREIFFYVAPYVEDGSLADRIERDGPLPVDEALRLAWEAADALAYAHAKGLLHRDIKPANILVQAGHACVADFGIARAIGGEEEGLTATGAQMFTPAYASPEQHAAKGIDQRSDLYALGCVLYEMLTGRLPFEGPTVESISLQRQSGPAPLIRKARREVPGRVEQLVAQALAVKADDRFPTAVAFREAIARVRRGPNLRPVFAMAGAVAVVAGVVIVVPKPWPWARAAADPLAFAVLPVEGPDSATSARLSSSLRDALAKWTGITVADERQVREALPSHDSPLTTQQAMRTASRVKAGRYLQADASRLGDSVRVHVGLYDAGGALVRERRANLTTKLSDIDAVSEVVIDRLLFSDSAAAGGTRSFAARAAQERGLAAVGNWQLERADSEFFDATERDPEYGRAHLWLAQVRYWKGDLPAKWQSSAERAASTRATLSLSEQLLSDALRSFGRGAHVDACTRWEALAQRDSYQFSAWYGLGTCLFRDNAVVKDARSRSGWRFRSSYHRSLTAFQQAFHLLPSILRSLRGGSFEAIRRLFLTGGSDIREGRALDSTSQEFGAYPSWSGDTLALIPFPLDAIGRGEARTIPPTTTVAVRRERERFHNIAAGWAAAFPRSADALEALAVSLEMLGDPTCLDTLRRARSLASDPGDRLRVGGGEVWMQVKFALPLDLGGLRAARSLADSLLDANGRDAIMHPRLLMSLAVLTGRANLAAAVSRDPAAYPSVPGAIARTAPSLLAYAALGGPSDSLQVLEQRLNSAIENLLAPEQRSRAKLEWLARSSTLAFPTYRMEAATKLVNAGDFLLDAQAALLRNDTAAVRRVLADIRLARRPFSPADITLDALYPEAAMLAAMGDARAVGNWLDPTLNELASTAPQVFADPARAGTLVRAMALRAEMASRLGDRAVAARWARPVLILWSGADAFLTPVKEEMERLVR